MSTTPHHHFYEPDGTYGGERHACVQEERAEIAQSRAAERADAIEIRKAQ